MRSNASVPIQLPLAAALLLVATACHQELTYDLKGQVAGLAGSGLVLRASIAPDLAVTRDGPVQFAGTWKKGTPLEVTVAAQPNGPIQTCTVVHDHGAVQPADALFAVSCVTEAYALGGSLSGLTGHGLLLQNAGVDELALEANGSFGFGKKVGSGADFRVSVKAQPTDPSQTCVVSGGAGTVVAGPVNSVSVTCETDRFAVGGTVNGLKGTGLLLQNAGWDELAVNANGSFAFAMPRASGDTYEVTVTSQPTGPAQTCSVASGSGLVTGAPVSGPVVTCVTNAYSVGGTVSGLTGAGLALRLNGGEQLEVVANGHFTFDGAVEAGQPWEVSVAAQPADPWQACSVSGGSGTMVAGEVESVSVQCGTLAFAIGGNVTNLSGSGLVLQQDGAGDLSISARGGFAFADPVASGATYAVTIKEQPTNPWQTCSVAAGSGTVASWPVSDVVVSCATDAFPIGGSVNGLSGQGLVLGNGADEVAVTSEGSSFELPPVASGASYSVVVVAQPEGPSQTCTVIDGTGVVAGDAVTGVSVTCANNAFTVGGSATGMPPVGLELANGSDTVILDFDGPWNFPAPVDSGTWYDVQVVSQPPTLACSIAQGVGQVGTAPVTSVEVTCGCAEGLADCDGNPGNGCEHAGSCADGGPY